MHKILIVEDDPIIQQSVTNELNKWGYQARAVDQFDRVLQTVIEFAPHLIVLDVTLPFFNGYHWCQEIRKFSKVPILFLSSRDQPMDVVMSINLGADDYITKPFEMSVLVAKIQGLLRRTYEFVGEQDVIVYHDFVLNLKTTKLLFQQHEIDLTKNEFQILRILFEHNDAYVSREQLMQALWDSDIFVDDNTLTVNVARLRKKLEQHDIEQLIVTKKGVGYGLVHSS